MTDIEQTLAEIRRRDSMYPNVELTAGAVQDRRTLLNIIDQLEAEINTDAQQLSRLLFHARESIDMFGDIVETRTGKQDNFSRTLRDEIDLYREERGWSPNGFGGEGDVS